MNTTYHTSAYDSPNFTRAYDDSVSRLMASAHATLEQPPPPSLREILTAYRTKGDGDRDMLLAMLNAKSAEDQRLSSVASLHRTMLEMYQQTSPILEPHHSLPSNGAYNHPPPTSYNHFPVPEGHRPSYRYRGPVPSENRSQTRTEMRSGPHDVVQKHTSERVVKRRRSSRSPHTTHTATYESSHPPEHYPLSPYSSSERSDSAEYSPRSRSSMTIGNLLSSRPPREATGDIPHDRD